MTCIVLKIVEAAKKCCNHRYVTVSRPLLAVGVYEVHVRDALLSKFKI